MQKSSTCRRRPDGNSERANVTALATPSPRFWAMEVRGLTPDLILKRESPGVLGGEGFEGDAVAEGLELGDGPLTLAIGVASDEVVATKVGVVAVAGEQVPGDHQD